MIIQANWKCSCPSMGMPTWQENWNEKGGNRLFFRSKIKTTPHLIVIWSTPIITAGLLFKSDSILQSSGDTETYSQGYQLSCTVFMCIRQWPWILCNVFGRLYLDPIVLPIQLSNRLENLKIFFPRVKESRVLKSTIWSLTFYHPDTQF